MFPGFSPAAIQFLRDLKKNNDRDWFQPRKEIFDAELKAPMIDLIEDINGELLKFAPNHVNDPKKAMYRIYRDTRFSKDKTPYKTHISAIFPPRGMGKHQAGGYYFQISPSGVGIAAGAYGPEKEELDAIRTWLLEHHEEFRAAAKKPKKLFGELGGDQMKRVPKGFPADHPAEDLLRHRQWFYWTELDVKLAKSPKLAPEIVKRFKAAQPVIEMLNGVLRRPKSKGARVP